jgi:hypothetical protein
LIDGATNTIMISRIYTRSFLASILFGACTMIPRCLLLWPTLGKMILARRRRRIIGVGRTDGRCSVVHVKLPIMPQDLWHSQRPRSLCDGGQTQHEACPSDPRFNKAVQMIGPVGRACVRVGANGWSAANEIIPWASAMMDSP